MDVGECIVTKSAEAMDRTASRTKDDINSDNVRRAAAVGALPESIPDQGEMVPRAVRILQLLLVAIIVGPLMLAIAGGYFSYRADVERAEAALREAVAVAEENTIKVLDTHQLVAARIDDLLAPLSDDEIRNQEQLLHEKLGQQISGEPQIAAAWAIDAAGHELVSARVYPVDRSMDQSQRDDFRALRNSAVPIFIWALRARDLVRDVYQPYFTVTRRRQSPKGEFRGIAVVSVSGAYLASFYRSLLQNSNDYTARVFREDGAELARYPAAEDGAVQLEHDSTIAAALADKSPGGMIVDGPDFGGLGHLTAYKQVDDYPVYVAITRTRASIFQEWFGSMTRYIAIGTPAALGLMVLCLVAVHRTRREQTALAHARDAIAQRATAESRLHQAQKMEALGQLSAGIAHDFNNLLTVILGNVAMLRLRLGGQDVQVDEFLASAVSGCERASQLTSRLLSFSRNEPLNPQPANVNEVIGGMSDILSRSLGKDVAYEILPSPKVWLVFADKNQLENSILNLALNARDAMFGQGRLVIQIANRSLAEDTALQNLCIPAGDYVVISVTDTGCGMSVKVRDKAFEPFYTTKEAGKGTGLGLSQVAGFAASSGGTCIIESALGQGTTVVIYLPRFPEEASSADSNETQTSSGDALVR
jgi:two-component system, NtrC family, sensor kinase